jgi:hypothetical protein
MAGCHPAMLTVNSRVETRFGRLRPLFDGAVAFRQSLKGSSAQPPYGKPLEPRPTLPATRTPRRRYQPGEDRALAVESDLSEGMVIQEQELDAIAALLGGALDDLLAGP